jgi:hypothetical protein
LNLPLIAAFRFPKIAKDNPAFAFKSAAKLRWRAPFYFRTVRASFAGSSPRLSGRSRKL